MDKAPKDKILNYSRILHIAAMCCFLLPFFYTGCQPTKAEIELREKAKQDSIKAAEQQDSLSKLSTTSSTDETSEDSSVVAAAPYIRVETDNLSYKLSEKFPSIKFILMPEVHTRTGTAAIIDSFYLMPMVATFISFLLLCLCLLLKYMDTQAKKSFALLNFMVLVFFTINPTQAVNSEVLYGYLIAFLFVTSLSFYDLYQTLKDSLKIIKTSRVLIIISLLTVGTLYLSKNFNKYDCIILGTLFGISALSLFLRSLKSKQHLRYLKIIELLICVLLILFTGYILVIIIGLAAAFQYILFTVLFLYCVLFVLVSTLLDVVKPKNAAVV